MTAYADFSETARDHALHPRNHGELACFDGHATKTGVCGDTMKFWLRCEGGHIREIGFDTDGCGASHACGSMATCLVVKQSLEEIEAISQQDILEALGGLPDQFKHCALLAADTLHMAVADVKKSQGRPKKYDDAYDICNLLSQSFRPRR